VPGAPRGPYESLPFRLEEVFSGVGDAYPSPQETRTFLNPPDVVILTGSSHGASTQRGCRNLDIAVINDRPLDTGCLEFASVQRSAFRLLRCLNVVIGVGC
jgi:hypothetical protein